MKYAVFSAVAVVTVICEFLYCSFMGVFKSKVNIKQYGKYQNDEIVPYSGISLILIMIICAALSFAVQMLFINKINEDVMVTTFIKLYVLFLIVFAAAVIDSKKKIIPNALIIFGIAFRACMYVYELVRVETIKTIVTSDLIGFSIGFGLLALVSIITKQGIGFGDAKLFAVIGLIGGMYCTISTLFISLIVSSLASVFFLISHKKDRKGSFPFGPCIAIGYIITICLSIY